MLKEKRAMTLNCYIRQLSSNYNFTLMCRDLSKLSSYAYVNNIMYRLIKNNMPGNYSLILKVTK